MAIPIVTIGSGERLRTVISSDRPLRQMWPDQTTINALINKGYWPGETTTVRSVRVQKQAMETGHRFNPPVHSITYYPEIGLITATTRELSERMAYLLNSNEHAGCIAEGGVTVLFRHDQLDESRFTSLAQGILDYSAQVIHEDMPVMHFKPKHRNGAEGVCLITGPNLLTRTDFTLLNLDIPFGRPRLPSISLPRS